MASLSLTKDSRLAQAQNFGTAEFAFHVTTQTLYFFLLRQGSMPRIVPTHLSVGRLGLLTAFSINSMIIFATSFLEDCWMPSKPGDEFTSMTTGP